MNRFIPALPLLALSLHASSPRAQAQDQPAPAAPTAPSSEQPFSFVLPWNDASKTVIDASGLNPAPLSESRRLRAEGGHFRDATGRRVRLLGVNITAGAAFPTHEDAAQVAARLHKFGVNCVRLHHMDAPWAMPNLFAIQGGSAGKPTRQLDAQSLDRLDFFVAQLKQHGIYVDLNLHVSRPWNQADGFEEPGTLEEHGKVVSYFFPRAIQLQQEFATQILTHLNPYTGQAYARDPAVAIVEMTNEDTLLGAAYSIPALPAPYQNALQSQWNAWLRGRYASSDKLLAAWSSEAVPLGQDVFPDGRFANGLQNWALEQHEGTKGELSIEDASGAGAPQGRVLKLSATQLDGTDWHLQLNRAGLDLKDGQLYTLSFAARSSTSRRVRANARLDQDPWSMIGLDETVPLGPSWQRYSFSFRAAGTVANHNRLSIVAGRQAGDVFLADVSLREGGGSVALEEGQSVEGSSIALGRMAPTPQGRDWAQFLIDTEGAYAARMKSTIRATGSTAPLLCSQASYGGIGGVWRESQLDVVDMHAYWQHPSFPRQGWDRNDFLIPNTSMVRSAGGGTLSNLAAHRVEGKPFIVSEYDHPAPSEFASEEVPMLLATAAWQDWDGLFFFEYGSTSAGQQERLSGFFNHSAHPGKWAFLPSMARVWLGGAMGAAPQSQVLVVPPARVASLVAEGRSENFWRAASSQPAFSTRSLWEKRSAVRFGSTQYAGRIESGALASTPASTSAISWNAGAAGDQPSGGAWTFACPSAVGAAGFLGGAGAVPAVAPGGVAFRVAPGARGFASMTLAALDGRPLARSRSLLLTAIDKAENAALGWNAQRTAAANSWSGPLQSYGVAAEIELPTAARQAQVFALDATGARRGQIASRLEGGRLSFAIAPGDATVWYEIAAR